MSYVKRKYEETMLCNLKIAARKILKKKITSYNFLLEKKKWGRDNLILPCSF